jgi:hypothetical protein
MNRIGSPYRRFIEQQFLPLPTQEQITALEQRINVKFPDDYRQFLLEYNGGYFTEPQIRPTSEDCPQVALTYLSGIGALHPGAELENLPRIALFDDNEPPQVVPIGCTAMGSLVVLATRPEDRGTIFLKEAFGGWFFLAEGIEGFFELLREWPKEDDDSAD